MPELPIRLPGALGRAFTLPYLATVAGLAICYFVTAKASLLLAIPPGHATAVWPPAGIALAALLLYGTRVWPGIWLGAALANFTVSASLPLPIAIATGNTLEALCAAWLMRRLMGLGAEFLRPELAFRFAMAAAAASVIAATFGVVSLYGFGGMPLEDFGVNWYTWWQGDATGTMIVAPFLLAWLRPREARGVETRSFELAVFAALFVLTFAAVFEFPGSARPDIARSLTFLLVPFIAWAGCRFDERVVTATILAAAGIAVWATITRHGPFLFSSRNESLLTLQAFTSTVALMGLVLCALTRERTDSGTALQESRHRLELTVQERTDELARKNQELAQDIAAKERIAAQLQAREAQLAEAQALTHVGSWNWDVATDRVTWSDELFRIYGVSPDQFQGTFQGYLSRVHPEDRERVGLAVQRAMSELHPWQLTERIVRPDGSVRVLKTIGRVLTNDAGQLVGMYGACLDATESVRLEQLQSVQLEVTKALVQAPAWSDAISSALRIICQTLGWSVGQMWQLEAGASALRRTHAWHSGAAEVALFVQESEAMTFEPGSGLPGRVWQQQSAVWVEDVVRDANFPRAALAERANLHRAFGVPLSAGSRILGVIEFLSPERQKSQPDLLQTLTAIGHQLGEYIVRNQAEVLLRQSEERFRLLVEGVREYAIFMLDRDGYVSTWNAGAHRLKGYVAEEIVGQHFSRFYLPEDLAAGKPDRAIRAAVEQGAVENEGWRVRRDGSRFWANVIITALYDSAGQLRGFAKVTRDMTERKQVEALEEADRHTRQFLAMLAHELRNPLAPIGNAVAVMRRHELADPALRDCRDLIERQVSHLSRLVDDLLDASRITSGKIGLQMDRMDARVAIARAIESSRALIEARGHSLHLDLPQDSLWIHGDLVRLAQVVQNLLNNAAKYTPEGGDIRLSLRAQRDTAELRVRDNGMGIARELLPRIFDLFMQAERGLDRSEGGLGIGLTLVRQIAGLHGGSVVARSEGPGQGAEFVVTLPLYSGSTAALELPSQARTPGSQSRGPRRVLVVDDNRDSADSLAMLLRLSNHNVWTAYDGESGLAAAAAHAPEVVLLDIGLPGMDGYEVATKLRGMPCGQNSLLIALTGYGQAEDRQRSEAAGFDEHLVKPVDIERLTRLIDNWPHTGA